MALALADDIELKGARQNLERIVAASAGQLADIPAMMVDRVGAEFKDEHSSYGSSIPWEDFAASLTLRDACAVAADYHQTYTTNRAIKDQRDASKKLDKLHADVTKGVLSLRKLAADMREMQKLACRIGGDVSGPGCLEGIIEALNGQFPAWAEVVGKKWEKVADDAFEDETALVMWPDVPEVLDAIAAFKPDSISLPMADPALLASQKPTTNGGAVSHVPFISAYLVRLQGRAWGFGAATGAENGLWLNDACIARMLRAVFALDDENALTDKHVQEARRSMKRRRPA